MLQKSTGYEVKIQIAYSDFEKFKYYCKNNNIVITDSTYSDSIECIVELNDNQREMIIQDINSENNYNIITFDTIRQKNISILSN